jgi:chemotaxis protein methyltransferase WspC
MCEAHVRNGGASVAAYYLLGLVCDARGEYSRAMECYRKALYLEPAHAEAALHLALLLEKQGETAPARRLRARAQRVEERAQ